ncbi:glycosyl hydrolase 108 family protein [uncultured Tenacibaculum sp.]|jgi:lysozyme family protein|uniref:glycoside hydrolase family 108 protein n=1 Tax=uncultured Tenacibaculum sp. TaxID=174713 RepID=UPI002609D422|nr:glycosyl hydrolase 108 family protein [uncultured Tenacibaculum sp.]
MASYELFKHSIQEAEGGYQNLTNDKGNYNSLRQRVGTNYGVSAKFYEKVIGRPPTIADMKSITQTEAHQLFKIHFWDAIKGDAIQSQAVAEMVADHSINANPRVTAGIVQRTLNRYFGKNLKVDSVIGAKTLQAINSVNPQQLFAKIGQERLHHYSRLDDYKYFSKSWNSRVFNLAKKYGISLIDTIKKKVPKRLS